MYTSLHYWKSLAEDMAGRAGICACNMLKGERMKNVWLNITFPPTENLFQAHLIFTWSVEDVVLIYLHFPPDT